MAGRAGKGARAASRHWEESIARAYEEVQTPLFLVAVEGSSRFRFVVVNRAFLAATGLKRRQIVGRLVREVIPKPSATMVARRYREAIRTGRAVHWEETSTYPAGEKHGEVAVTPLRADDGRIALLAGIVHDVTARDDARRRARESEEMFSKAFYENPTAMAIRRHSDDTIVAVNRSFERLFGYRKGELVGKEVEALGFFPSGRRKASEKRGRVRGIEVEMRGRDGVVRTILKDVDRISLKGQACALASFVDITPQKKAAEVLLEVTRSSQSRSRQLEAMAAALVSTEQRERRRLANIVHEGLQQQLVAASMQLKLLAKSYAGEPAPASLELAKEILSDALATARSLCQEINPPAPFQAGLDTALQWLAGQMRRMYGLDVEMRLPEPLPRFPDSTQGFLFGAVRELLFNCVKHARVPAAKVLVAHAGDALRIQVVDEGRGFDPVRLEREVSGMGLISIRESLAVLGGRLELDATPKRGCRATIVVPLPKSARSRGR